MIQEFASDIANQIGIQLSRVSVTEGRPVGATDVYLLSLAAGEHLVSTLIYQSELDHLQNGTDSGQLEEKIRAALERLRIQLEP
jgi:hypothetical protein